MPGKVCRVSLKDADGVRHTVDMVANSVYEAAVQALATLSKHDWVENVGAGTRLDIEIIEPPVTHTLLVGQLRAVAQPAGGESGGGGQEAEAEDAAGELSVDTGAHGAGTLDALGS